MWPPIEKESDLRTMQEAAPEGVLCVEHADAKYRKEVSTHRTDLSVLLWATERDPVLFAGLSHFVCEDKAREEIPAAGPPQGVPGFVVVVVM